MTAYEIPTRSASPERFTVALSGQSYQLTLKWNRGLQAWTLDLADATGAPLVSGLALTAGVNVLSQFPHLGVPGELRVITDGDELTPPTFENLGTGARLIYITE